MPGEKVPLIRLAKREGVSRREMMLIRALAFMLAIILGGGLFALIGVNPLSAYANILSGSLGKASAIRQTVKIAIPLLGTAVALAPCFKMHYWNIGAEGQITAGAIAATFFALNFSGSMPRPLLILCMTLGAVAFGGLWAMIPAVFKARYGTNETLFTLMMNYIIIGVVKWLQGGPWEGKSGSQIIPSFASSAMLPKVFGVHCGWIVVLLLTAGMYFYMNKTKQGYEIAVVGDSENTARYAGMNVPLLIVRTAFISGAISGIVGFLVTCGANGTLYDSVADGVGFTAITVTWLSQFNPFAMIFISGLLAVLDKGASTLQTRMSVPESASNIITGIILFCMLSCEFFINFRVILRGEKGDKS